MSNTVDSQVMEADDDEEVDDNSSIPSLVSDDTDLTVETPRNINYTPNTPPFIVQNEVGRRYQRIINRDDDNNVSVNLTNVFNNEATDNNIRPE